MNKIPHWIMHIEASIRIKNNYKQADKYQLDERVGTGWEAIWVKRNILKLA